MDNVCWKRVHECMHGINVVSFYMCAVTEWTRQFIGKIMRKTRTSLTDKSRAEWVQSAEVLQQCRVEFAGQA